MLRILSGGFWRRHELLKDSLMVIFYCSLIASVIWVTEAGEFWMTLQVSLVFGAACLSSIRLSIYYLKDRTSVAAATVLGYLGGVVIGMTYLMSQIYESFDDVMAAPWSDLSLKVLFSMLVTYVFYNSHRLSRKERELQDQRMQALMQEKKLAESNYQMLQSQIEPHFLFNTLANIQVLIKIRPEAAQQMIEDLTSLLRVSMSKVKQPRIKLTEELDLVAAYLSIQKVRMGERLNFDIQKKGEVDNIDCPPFLLQPLVENSVIHGIEPSLQGGHIDISVSVDHRVCKVKIRDTGLGLAPNWEDRQQATNEHGIALKNVRQRLQLIYGEAASFSLRNAHNDHGQVAGCIAEVEWPIGNDTPAIARAS